MDFKLSNQDECYNAMAQCFIHSSACLPFRTFRDDSCLQMMNTVAGENDLQTLTIPYLKSFLNAECNTFANAAKK